MKINKTTQAKINKLLNRLSSAYQEQAIEQAVDTWNNYEIITRQEFADESCENYRDILNSLIGYTIKDIYQGFRRYGGEGELQEIAYLVLDVLNNAELEEEKKQDQENKKDLEFIKKALEEICNDTTLDFLGEYGLEDINYLSDTFHEFSDNNISVYYSDQYNYFVEHSTECEDALLELYDGDFLADKIKKEGLYNLCCFAGVCGQYESQLQELYTNEAEIKKLLVVRYLLKNDIFLLNLEQLTDLLEQAESNQIDRGEELLDLINNALQETTEENEERED